MLEHFVTQNIYNCILLCGLHKTFQRVRIRIFHFEIVSLCESFLFFRPCKTTTTKHCATCLQFPKQDRAEKGENLVFFFAALSQKYFESPHRNRTCHGWSGCNGLCPAFAYIYVSGPETKLQISLHLLQM